MARETAMQTAFNAGEWRRTLDGRVDQERYRAACRELVNFVPLVEGPAELRAGARFVAEPHDETRPVTLIPFEFNAEQAYVLEFGEFTLRVFTLGGLVLSGGLPYVTATPFSAEQARRLQWKQSADVMWLAHPDLPPQRLERLADDDWRIEGYDPDWAPFAVENTDQTLTVYASASTGAAITLTASSDLFLPEHVGSLIRLREVPESEHSPWEQRADPISQDTGGTISVDPNTGSTVVWEGNVYRAVAGSGSTTGRRPPIHGPDDPAEESDGRLTWRYLHSGAGYARITGYTSATVVTAEVVHFLPASVVGVSGATFRWAWGAWDSVRGYPRALAFFEDRLWWGGTRADPDSVWATRPGGDYDDFRPSDDAEGALLHRLNAEQPNVIESMAATKVLQLLTSGGVFPAQGSDPSLAASVENLLSVERQVSYGARAGVQALVVDSVSVFVQRSGRALRELLFDFDQDSFQAPDLAKVSAHLVAAGVARMAYQQEPNRTLWCVLDDGGLVAATYDRPQEVLGWWRCALGAGDGVAEVESLAVIQHEAQDVDQVWLAVKRTFAGGRVLRSVEFLERQIIETSALEDAFFVDCGSSYEGAPTDTVTGLARLEGQTVRILADGARAPDQVVAGGQVTIPEAASKIHVGLGYDGVLVPMRFEAGGSDGVAQGRQKRIGRIVVRFWRTAEGTYVGVIPPHSEVEALDFVHWRTPVGPLSAPIDMVDGDTFSMPWPGEWEQGGYVAVVHRAPTPCTVVAVIPQVVTGER